MTTGEFEFDSIFWQDLSGESDDLEEIPFPPVSVILWIVFIVIMPILFTNLLVSFISLTFMHRYLSYAIIGTHMHCRLVLLLVISVKFECKLKFRRWFNRLYCNKVTIVRDWNWLLRYFRTWIHSMDAYNDIVVYRSTIYIFNSYYQCYNMRYLTSLLLRHYY